MATLKISDATPLANRISTVRAAFGWSQETLAGRAGLDRLVIRAIEAGKNQVSARTVLKGLAQAFGATLQEMDDLIEGQVSAERFLELIGPRPSALDESPGSGPGSAGGGGSRAGAHGGNARAALPSNRQINTALDRAEQRFETPKPNDRRQAKARRR